MGSREHLVSFDYEIDALATTVSVEARVVTPPIGHSSPNDPDNDAEVELVSVVYSDGEKKGEDFPAEDIAIRNQQYDKGRYSAAAWKPLYDILIERACDEVAA